MAENAVIYVFASLKHYFSQPNKNILKKNTCLFYVKAK